jgi:serine/threonine protein kinase
MLTVAGEDAVKGTPFGRYRLVELLGRGGMGEVWRAHDTVTDRVVAIKVLPANLSEDEDFQRRFRREAHAAARLDTPHVVPIYDYGEIDGRLFVSMRLINGRDLNTVLADGPLEPARAVRIIDQVAKALHAAHKLGLIHRDIKPSNILLDDDDFAYLIDFGIAHAADETRMTKSGNMIATFAYIAPERLDPRTEEDARVDIYSLACVLYQALTGEPPFAGTTTAHLIAAHLNTPPPRPSTIQPTVPPQVDEVIATGMAKDPDQRYVTTVELADAARGAITVPISRPTPSPPTLPATEQAPLPATQQAPLPPTQQAGDRVTRRTKIGLIVGAVILATVVAVAIPVTIGHPSSRPPQTQTAQRDPNTSQTPTAQPGPNTFQPVPTSTSNSAPSFSAPAQPTDYTRLLIQATDIDAPVQFKGSPPVNNPNGQPGVATTFSTEDNSHVIKDTIQVLADPAAATNALSAAKGEQKTAIKNPQPGSANVGTGATTLSGNKLDGSKGVLILLFTEGKAFVTLEFDGPTDSLPPEDFVNDVGGKQAAAVKKGLGG